MEEQMNDSVKALRDHLRNGDTKNAMSLARQESFAKCYLDSGSDLLTVICEHVNEKTICDNKKLFNCCVKLINLVVEKSPWDEILFQLIEQLELLNDTKFITLCEPLQKTMLKSTSEMAVEWCLNAIHGHLQSLPIPEEEDLEGEERKLLDCYESVQRISDMYNATLPFYNPLLEKLKDSVLDVKAKTELKNAMLWSFFKILGRPLVFMDLESNDKVKSNCFVIVEKIMKNISKIVKDPISFLSTINLNNIKKDLENSQEDFSRETIVHDTVSSTDSRSSVSLGVFYYMLFVEKVTLENVPSVYNPLFIFENCLYLCTIFLKSSVPSVQREALLLADAMLNMFTNCNLSHEVLDSIVCKYFIEGLFTVSVYCPRKSNRLYSVNIIKKLIFKFDYEGRYTVLFKMIKLANHSGLIGYLSTQFKDLLNEILCNPSKGSEYFTQKRILSAIDLICNLPYKAQSDLIELSDQIISGLNLIRFLIIRDMENRTGIWDHLKYLEGSFLSPLKEGIDLSRAHYKLKLKDIRDGKDMDSKVPNLIGNLKMPNVPHEEKVMIIEQALNAFDVMESLNCRLSECIQINTKK